LNSTSSELQQLKDMFVHQKKRTTDMLSNLLKDIAEIGAAIGSEAELNVSNFQLLLFVKSKI
jgi:kinesin family member 5